MGGARETGMLESGDVFFLYRPKVEEDAPSGLEDVQRFHVVLRPRGGRPLRLLVVGRKRLPDLERHERLWGFVDRVTDSADALETALREQTYGTKTRGERRLPAVRPAGEGVYAISLEDGRMHLSYSLELPQEPGDVQRALRIAPEASFALSVKNPQKGAPVGAERGADYPDALQASFRGRRFSREDLRLLDYEGAELILVGARTNPGEAYGLEIDTQARDYAHADTIRHLRMVRSRHPVEPLFQGDWA